VEEKMRLSRALLWGLPVVALVTAGARDARACGGCFNPPFMQQTETGLVSGHRMILSVSQTQTTLWDQIQYSGNPASFAWVLPIKGQVTVGVSSDALFANLDQETRPQVIPPAPPSCGGTATGTASSTFNGNGGSAGFTPQPPPTILSQQVVGPYQTVQLSSTNPTALETWLLNNGYNIPASIAPLISAYVNEGFDFLAIKLVPGQGVSAMQPVRVTSPGASTALPLRMVSAGTGPTVEVKLWIFGEGRYAPTNFPSFAIDDTKLVWDWTSSSSNYTALEQQGYASTSGTGWLVEAAVPFAGTSFSQQLCNLAAQQPAASGYADATGQGAPTACAADMTTLFGNITAANLWVTRLKAELPQAALAADLQVGAATDQSFVSTTLVVSSSVGNPCATGSGSSSGGTTGGGGSPGAGSQGGCAMTDGGSVAPLGVLALAAMLALSRVRRRERA
jgi:hypothetical protein